MVGICHKCFEKKQYAIFALLVSICLKFTFCSLEYYKNFKNLINTNLHTQIFSGVKAIFYTGCQ